MQADEKEDKIGFSFYISGEQEMQAGDKNVRWNYFKKYINSQLLEKVKQKIGNI